jgi:phage tail-like protein
MSDPVNVLRFDVRVDGLDLGGFTALEGISAEYEVLTYAEGGENTYVHQLPGRLKYGNIKLTRPVDMMSTNLGVWFRLISKGAVGWRQVATVTAFNDNGEPIAEWAFDGVYPVRYTGPSFTTENGRVATESFEFAHNGLML